MRRVTRRIVLVGLPPEAAALVRKRLAQVAASDVAELAPQEAIAQLVRDSEDVDALVTWDDGAGGGVAFGQRVARIDRRLPVVILAPAERADTTRRAVQFAPFLGDEVCVRSTDDLDLLPADISTAAERGRSRRTGVADGATAGEDTMPDGPEHAGEGYAEHALRHAPVGVATLDPVGVIHHFNPEAARMLGVDRDTAFGQALRDLVPPEQRDRVRRLIESAGSDLAARSVIELEQNGGPRYVELSASRYLGPGAEPSTVVILGDVTDRERAAERLRHLQAVTDAALGNSDLDEMLAELLARIRDALAVDTVAVLLVDEAAGEMRIHASHGLDRALDELRVPLGQGFSGRIALTHEPYRLSHVEADDVMSAAFGESPVSLLGVPLLVGERLIGVLHVGSRTAREFDDDDQALLQLVGDRVALAINHARLYAAQHETAEVLQRSLLPQRLPLVPGLSFAARYNPAGPDIEVGGDWYDVTPLGGGQVALSIGDVVGRGLRAAAVMGHLRAAVRAYTVEGHGPGAALQRLNELVVHGRRSMATAALVNWDPNGSLRIARAGHPPPLLVGPDGEPRLIEDGGGPALGVIPFASYGEATVDLPPGARVVLYTDGLIERRGESLDISLDRLLDAARGAPPGADALADRLLGHLLEDSTDDDAALLVLEAPPRTTRLELDLPARPESLGLVRTHLRRWLLEHGAGRDTVEQFAIACGEACTNVIEHAYGPRNARFRVEAENEHGDAVVTVRDFGRWREQREAGRGRGFTLIRALMDDVTVDTGEQGTAVRMRRRLDGNGAA